MRNRRDNEKRIIDDFINFLESDIKVDDENVIKSVKEWKEHLNKYYYECTDHFYLGLARLYVEDKTYSANIDKHKKGLAEYISRAIEKYYAKD